MGVALNSAPQPKTLGCLGDHSCNVDFGNWITTLITDVKLVFCANKSDICMI